MGSPIVAIDCANMSPKKFDKMFFVDLKEENIQALYERLKLLSEKEEFGWIKGDVN